MQQFRIIIFIDIIICMLRTVEVQRLRAAILKPCMLLYIWYTRPLPWNFIQQQVLCTYIAYECTQSILSDLHIHLLLLLLLLILNATLHSMMRRFSHMSVSMWYFYRATIECTVNVLKISLKCINNMILSTSAGAV